MVHGLLPDEGPARIGPVTLPAGKPIAAAYASAEPVAWATVDPVPEPGRAWAALSAVRGQTGLVPILLDGLHGDTRRPWDNGEFGEPEDPRRADTLDVGALLADMWGDDPPDPDGEEAADAAMLAPFTSGFPGLAAPERVALTPAERQSAVDSALPRIRAEKRARSFSRSPRLRGMATPWARVGLVAASRPADVLAAIGWGGTVNLGDFLPTLTAVLRSWEDRFGATLVDVGFAEIRLLVGRPPRTLEAAQRVAAEHFVLADECIGNRHDIAGIAELLVNSPIWTFWWD